MTMGLFVAFYALTVLIVGIIAENKRVQSIGTFLAIFTISAALLDSDWTKVPF